MDCTAINQSETCKNGSFTHSVMQFVMFWTFLSQQAFEGFSLSGRSAMHMNFYRPFLLLQYSGKQTHVVRYTLKHLRGMSSTEARN